jgi:hypothetical protein
MRWDIAGPVLRATYASIESSNTGMTGGEKVCADLGMLADDAAPIFRALEQAGYIGAYFGASGFPQQILPTEKGLQYCLGWPSSGSESAFVAELLGAIETRADDESVGEEERSRLRSLGRAAADVGKDVLTEIVSKVIALHSGM